MAISPTDDSLIGQVVEGNTAAFSVLVVRYQRLAFQLAYKLLRQREAAEEVTQDAFLKAYQALPDFKGEAKFSTWLYRIVYTTAISHARRKQVPVASLSDQEDSVDHQVVDDSRNQLQKLAEQDQKVYLEAALAALPPDESLLITLFYQYEHSVEEISQIVGLTKANIKIKLLRSRRKLYAVLHRLLKHEIADIL